APSSTIAATPTTCTISFTDVSVGSTFYEHIRCLACRGIVSGYSDGTYRPNNPVTRGQLSKIVSGTAGFTEDPGPQMFRDVATDNTFYQWINRLARRGLMSGYSCGGPGEPCIGGMPYFRPSASASRGQTSKIVAGAAYITQEPSGQTFEDVPLSNPFYRWVEQLASLGVMGGYDCGGVGEPCGPGRRPYFRWGANVTRGQTAKIVANTFYPGCAGPSE
ncbi:MAG TPA: S-layer homology domain-containing protein, partial [Chloroflexia bacterium]|nr:S-layer homology domain-containing protein [Chloroflexia bacterium]